MKARGLNLVFAWLLTSLLNAAVGVAFYVSGKAADCKPRQIDGQCRY